MSSRRTVPLAGSERAPLPGARRKGAVDPDERAEITVVVRPGAELADLARRTRAELADRHGATADDLDRVAGFATDHRLDVSWRSAARRSIALAGSVGALGRAFGVELARYETPGGVAHRGRVGALEVPVGLADAVDGVFGLDDRPQAQPHFRVLDQARRAEATAYSPLELARRYDFPGAPLDGAAETIAIVELGGGYRIADLGSYFGSLGIPTPAVITVGVDGATNAPSGPDGADGEVMLDIEVAGAVAPAAQSVVYFAPNSDRGFLDAVTSAIHDTTHRPSVVSISWGGAETAWTEQALRAFDHAFRAAAALGVTVCCASGDNGSDDGVGDGRAHVDFPASSPHVLACGGTRLDARSETVWNDGAGATGGGVSDVFRRPAYQHDAGVPASANDPAHHGRGVPDVAGDADPATGYRVRVDGRDLVIGGTSAVAPRWSGLVALVNQALGAPVGFLNPTLYAADAATALRDVTEGSNGAYQAAVGWDACTGLGTPDGAKLLEVFRAAAR